MLRLCHQNRGAISVFLTLILLPVLLLGGLTTDAARIYTSKVVISDAGEMAMNAGLAQYEKRLHDEYGLLVMEKSPEEMEAALKSFFERSLNGTGFSEVGDYKKILDLVTEKFDAINLAGSQIYKTEVEKQQIVEYMKYRAPVCLTELVLEKLEVLRDAKKMADAMEDQLEFGEAMEKCQDAMEEAKVVLDSLNLQINQYPTPNTINHELEAAQGDYTIRVSRCLLMLAAISHYTEADSRNDAEAGARSYIGAAAGVSVGDDADRSESFESYMQCLYYKAGVDNAGGLEKVLEEHRAQEPDEEDKEAHDAWSARMDELEELSNDYHSAQDDVEGYPNQLRRIAYEYCIVPHTNTIHGYWEQSKKGEETAKKAYDKLVIVKRKLEEAEKKWKNWSDSTAKLGDKAGSMKESVDDYGKFFGGGEDDDMGNLELLMENVETDSSYFHEMKDILTGEKFFGKSLATVDSKSQYDTYFNQANALVDSSTDQFMDIEGIRTSSFIPNYQHITIPAAKLPVRIDSSPFYVKLIEYCETSQSEEAKQKKKETNDKLDKSKEAGEDAQSEDGYLELTWTWTLDGTMPSKVLEMEAEEDANDKMTSVGGDVNDGSGRKKAVSKFKDSISEAGSFLGNLEKIITDNLANLYVAEYAMQLFSYYTVDQKDGEKLDDSEIIGLSGYKLSEHKPYKAEVEYILWGDTSSARNVAYTVMLIFGIRLLFNSFFAFTNQTITGSAKAMATIIAGPAPYLVPVLQFIIQLAAAGVETADDIGKIKEGYGVTIIKSEDTWATAPFLGDNTKEATLNYPDYLRIFLNINMLSGKEVQKLSRIADCIKVNTDFDMINGYTMLAIEAKVKVRTTFMRKISELGSGGWRQPGDTYTVQYQSLLGY